MAIYDGVVTLADDEIPVIVELDENSVRLSASGREIGQWHGDECVIHHVADEIYSITAEDETLEFIPSQPSLFAAAVNGGVGTPVAPPPEPRPESGPETERGSEPESGQAESGTGPDITADVDKSHQIREAPPAKPLTMGLFYALCVVTAILAVWSLISIVM